MKRLSSKAHAKINLFLDICGKYENGYHELKTIMQEIELHDEIIVELNKNEDVITCTDKSIPIDKKNICYKVLDIIRKRYNLESYVSIHIIKNIPSEAGMAGGSSDAATVIKLLDKLWNLEMSESQMNCIGKEIGADVPFCLKGGTCLCEGIGEKITRLVPFTWDNIVIVKPDFSICTKTAYNNVLKSDYNLCTDSKIIDLIQNKKYVEVCNNLHNTLEVISQRIFPEVNIIKEELCEYGAINSLMTGSGSAVYGFYKSLYEAQKAYTFLKNKYKKVYITSTKKAYN